MALLRKFGLEVLIASWLAVSTYIAASWLNMGPSGQAKPSFRGIWSLTIFLNTFAIIFNLIPVPSALSHRIVQAWYWSYYAWGISVLYQFNFIKSIVTAGLSYGSIFAWILMADFAGAFVLKVNPALARRPIVSLRHDLAGLPSFEKEHPNVVALVDGPILFEKITHRSRRVARFAPPRRMDTAADFNWDLTDLEGKAVPMSRFKGKVIFLNFWAAWCAPCRQEMPGIQRLFDADKQDPNMAIICANVESVRDARNFLRWSKYTFPIYIANRGIPAVFKSSALPTSFLISRDGRIVAKQAGAGAWDDPAVVHMIGQLLSNSRP